MYSIVIDERSWIGSKLVSYWYAEIGSYDVDINSPTVVIHQSLALTLFLFVIAVTIFRMEWRVVAVFFSLVMVVILGIVPPQNLIKSAIEWDLILFLIGSMTLAGVLRELGVFKYLAVNAVRVSRGNSIILLTLILTLAFILSALLGEVTSIIYVVMLLFELSKLFRINVAYLIILAVLSY
jgi:Na+/H+ antiporter NhaD/arsenite permease-like protein